MEHTDDDNKAAGAPSGLNVELGAFVCEKWVVWYDGTTGYTPGYLRGNGINLYESEEQADNSNSMIDPTSRGAYHSKRVLIYEALNARINAPPLLAVAAE